jgi:hypothetical protein
MTAFSFETSLAAVTPWHYSPVEHLASRHVRTL